MPETLKTDYQLQAAWYATIRRYLRFSKKNARVAGVSTQQYQLLLAIIGIKERDWAIISELSELLCINNQATLELCQQAERDELIRRRPIDSRSHQTSFQLTEKGKMILDLISQKDQPEFERIQLNLLSL